MIEQLTEEQKAEAKKIMDELIGYVLSMIKTRMIVYGETYDEAWLKTQEELLNG